MLLHPHPHPSLLRPNTPSHPATHAPLHHHHHHHCTTALLSMCPAMGHAAASAPCTTTTTTTTTQSPPPPASPPHPGGRADGGDPERRGGGARGQLPAAGERPHGAAGLGRAHTHGAARGAVWVAWLCAGVCCWQPAAGTSLATRTQVHPAHPGMTQCDVHESSLTLTYPHRSRAEVHEHDTCVHACPPGARPTRQFLRWRRSGTDAHIIHTYDIR